MLRTRLPFPCDDVPWVFSLCLGFVLASYRGTLQLVRNLIIQVKQGNKMINYEFLRTVRPAKRICPQDSYNFGTRRIYLLSSSENVLIER